MKYLMLSLILLAAGCGVNKPIEGRADPYAPAQIHFADADLANKTAVSPPIMERRNGILYVTVPIRSAVNLDLHVDYKVSFFNEAGAPIEQSGWTGGTTLVSNTPSYIKFNSMSANAHDFQMDVRWSQ
jgi:hypothetical protein